MASREMIERITDYLASGGLFNPELMPPEKVRDLLIDCRNVLSSLDAAPQGEDVGGLVEALEMARHELWKTGASESEGNALWHVRSALSAYERSTTDGQS